MGIVRQGHALSDDLGPGFGRGTGVTTQEEKNVSNAVGAQAGALYACQMHPEVASDKPGKCPKCGMALVKKQLSGVALAEAEKKKVPGYPQDMMMIVDDDVAKPETYGLAPGWTASMMGMMTLVRVLPEDKYDEIMALVKRGETWKPPSAPEHKHND
jgi:Heavy metal binding domain